MFLYVHFSLRCGLWLSRIHFVMTGCFMKGNILCMGVSVKMNVHWRYHFKHLYNDVKFDCWLSFHWIFCLSLCLFIHDTIIVCLGWLVRLEVMILMMIRCVVWYSWCCIISCAVKLLSPSIFWMFIVMSVANNSMNCFFVSSMVIWCTAGIKFVMFSTDGDTC